MENLKKQLRNFAKERDWDQFHSPKNLAMALSVEASEIVEHFQWLTEQESSNLSDNKLSHVKEEIADVFIYLLRLSDKLGVDLLQEARKKLLINEKKYPIEKSKGNAKKYSEFEG